MQPSLFGRLDRPSAAVLFAGFGGSCLGIQRAIGVSPIVAINHDEHAIRLHQLNHPDTFHEREDVWRVQPRSAVRGRRLDLLWLSPDCTDHANAKGSKPRDTGRRSLANAVFPWVEECRPELICLENVREFLDWGPLNASGKRIEALKGSHFRAFVAQLQSYGYTVDWRILQACDYGAPTIRQRLYLIARCDGQPISWPSPTHGGINQPPHLPAHPCIDLTDPGTREVTTRPLRPKSMARIDAGLSQLDRPGFAVHHPGGRSFIVVYYGQGQARSLNLPLPTITTVARFGLVTVAPSGGIYFRMLRPRELARANGFPDNYILEGTTDQQIARIGNAVVPVMAEVIVRANQPSGATQ